MDLPLPLAQLLAAVTLALDGTGQAIVPHLVWPTTLAVDGQATTWHRPRDVALPLTGLIPRITAFELPRRDRFRVWLAVEAPVGPLQRMVLSCVLQDGRPLVERLEWQTYRTPATIIPLRRSA